LIFLVEGSKRGTGSETNTLKFAMKLRRGRGAGRSVGMEEFWGAKLFKKPFGRGLRASESKS